MPSSDAAFCYRTSSKNTVLFGMWLHERTVQQSEPGFESLLKPQDRNTAWETKAVVQSPPHSKVLEHISS